MMTKLSPWWPVCSFECDPPTLQFCGICLNTKAILPLTWDVFQDGFQGIYVWTRWSRGDLIERPEVAHVKRCKNGALIQNLGTQIKSFWLNCVLIAKNIIESKSPGLLIDVYHIKWEYTFILPWNIAACIDWKHVWLITRMDSDWTSLWFSITVTGQEHHCISKHSNSTVCSKGCSGWQ